MARPGRLIDEVVLQAAASAASDAAAPGLTIEEVTKRDTDGGVEARSVSARIRTVDDLLRHIEADLTRFEVVASEATKWEGLTADKATGRPVISELHRVFVRLRPRGGPSVEQIVAAMIEGAASAGRIGRPRVRPRRSKRRGIWQVVVVADPHFGKYAWSRTTGQQDYDLDHADRLVRNAGEWLIEAGDRQDPALRTIALLGDVFHYDTPDARTTRGTQLERDGRLEKMISTGTAAVTHLIERSSQTCQTDVVIVPGNHDETMSAWLRLLLETHFKADGLVKIHDRYTHRQYLEHRGNLLGFAHGDKARAKLPSLMALEMPEAWSRCRCREIHTGHLHKQGSRIRRVLDSDGIDTVDGVVVRTAPALCPPDDWHSQEGYIGSRQAMETWFYADGGGLAGMLVAGGQ
jgi:predicted phosphodiesterase